MAVRKKPSTEAFRTEDCISNLEDLVFLALAGNQCSGSLPNSWSLAVGKAVFFFFREIQVYHWLVYGCCSSLLSFIVGMYMMHRENWILKRAGVFNLDLWKSKTEEARSSKFNKCVFSCLVIFGWNTFLNDLLLTNQFLNTFQYDLRKDRQNRGWGAYPPSSHHSFSFVEFPYIIFAFTNSIKYFTNWNICTFYWLSRKGLQHLRLCIRQRRFWLL